MSRTLAVLGCGELVTMRGPARPRIGAEMRELSILRDGAIFVREDRIAAVGSRSDIERLIGPDTEIYEARGQVVTPGFVDAHTHPVFAGTRVAELEMRAAGRTYSQIAEAGGGIRSTVRMTRMASQEDLVCAGRRYAGWFLRCGTTTIEAKSGYGLSIDDELKILRAIRELGAKKGLRYVPTFLGAHIVPDEYGDRRSDYVDLVAGEMLPRVAQEQLAEYCDVFCDSGAFTVGESEHILKAGRALGLRLRIHADQLAETGASQLAATMGATTADHLEYTGQAGIAALAAARVQPVLLPGSVLATGAARHAPARAMIDAGLAVVLATDFNPGSSPTPSLPLVMALAASTLRMTPAESLTAVTVNAAWSVGRGQDRGTLEPGKLADFAVHDCRDHRELAYFFGIEQTAATFVGGREVFSRS